jgi:hypothetical protein
MSPVIVDKSTKRGAGLVDQKELSLGYEEKVFIETDPPNYTPPGKPSFVDIFKGHDGDDYLFKTYLLSKYAFYVTSAVTLFDVTVGTAPKVSLIRPLVNFQPSIIEQR